MIYLNPPEQYSRAIRNLCIIAAPAVLGLGFNAEPAQAVPYPARCQFNNQRPMACTVSSNPFTWRIQWADGVSEAYVRRYTPDTNTLVDERGGVWNRQSNDTGKQEVLTHANGNRITINFGD